MNTRIEADASASTLYERTFGRAYRRTPHSLATEVEGLRELGEFTDRDAWRLVICQSIDTYDSRRKWGTLHDAIATFEDEPAPSGHAGLDAATAALTEYLAHRDGWDAPSWAQSESRVASQPWVVGTLPTARLRAVQEAPAEFAQRGVYVSPSDLVRV
ncbi:MAG: hypothetical protein ACK5LO_07625 [Leucobacter sp.]